MCINIVCVNFVLTSAFSFQTGSRYLLSFASSFPTLILFQLSFPLGKTSSSCTWSTLALERLCPCSKDEKNNLIDLSVLSDWFRAGHVT